MLLQNVYVLAELAERIVGVIVVKNGWIVQTYPGKIKLPADIFKPLPSHDVQQDVSGASENYHMVGSRPYTQLARKSWLDPATIDEVLGSLSISRTAGKVGPLLLFDGFHVLKCPQRKADHPDKKPKSKRRKPTPSSE